MLNETELFLLVIGGFFILLALSNITANGDIIINNKYVCHNCGNQFRKKWYSIIRLLITIKWFQGGLMGWGKCPSCKSRDTSPLKNK